MPKKKLPPVGRIPFRESGKEGNSKLQCFDRIDIRDNPIGEGFYFWCPACEEIHCFTISVDPNFHPNWKFNDDYDKPSFTPSLLYPSKPVRCHLFLTDGKIHYCDDCGHSMAGKVVDMVDIPY